VRRAATHDDFYLNVYRVHLSQYEGQYSFWDNAMVMNVKISGNNIYYWGCLGLLFFHRKLGDLDLMAAVRADVERMWGIITRLEAMYREWNELEQREWRRAMVPSQAFPAMFDRHRDMIAGFDDEGIKRRMKENADLLEAYAVLAFYRAAQNLGDAAPGEDEKINPYAVSLDPDCWKADGLLDGQGLTVAEARQTPAGGMENLFMEAIAQPA
jgi:hypothetical protein